MNEIAARWLRAGSLVVASIASACGPTASSVREEELLAPGTLRTTLAEGRVQQDVGAYVPAAIDPASCRLHATWRSGSAEGVAGPFEPMSISGHHASWTVLIDVGDADVVRVESMVSCGDVHASALADHVATDAGRARYCGLCGERVAHPPTPAREWGRPGLRLTERVGIAARVEGSTIVDACTGRVLLDVGDMPGARLGNGADPESEAEVLLRAERGESVCERAWASSYLTLEADPSELPDITQRLANMPELDVELSLDPYPG